MLLQIYLPGIAGHFLHHSRFCDENLILDEVSFLIYDVFYRKLSFFTFVSSHFQDLRRDVALSVLIPFDELKGLVAVQNWRNFVTVLRLSEQHDSIALVAEYLQYQRLLPCCVFADLKQAKFV
jgi:hypothetical protein